MLRTCSLSKSFFLIWAFWQYFDIMFWEKWGLFVKPPPTHWIWAHNTHTWYRGAFLWNPHPPTGYGHTIHIHDIVGPFCETPTHPLGMGTQYTYMISWGLFVKPPPTHWIWAHNTHTWYRGAFLWNPHPPTGYGHTIHIHDIVGPFCETPTHPLDMGTQYTYMISWGLFVKPPPTHWMWAHNTHTWYRGAFLWNPHPPTGCGHTIHIHVIVGPFLWNPHPPTGYGHTIHIHVIVGPFCETPTQPLDMGTQYTYMLSWGLFVKPPPSHWVWAHNTHTWYRDLSLYCGLGNTSYRKWYI